MLTYPEGLECPIINRVFIHIQGSYREDCVKFKDFSRTSKDFPTVFQGLNFMKKKPRFKC